MIGRTNSSVGAGNAVRIDSVPTITFNGNWLPWHIELYGGVPYWEAWFFSSGTLTVTGSYPADAWGIGGGSGPGWSSSAAQLVAGNAGSVSMSLGITLTGSIAVTIGAGSDHAWYPGSGGATKLGSYLTCAGGLSCDTDEILGQSDPNRYRFSDEGHKGDIGAVGTVNFKYNGGYPGGGWLPFSHLSTCTEDEDCGSMGQGFGAGAGPYMHAAPGALVIRIPI